MNLIFVYFKQNVLIIRLVFNKFTRILQSLRNLVRIEFFINEIESIQASSSFGSLIKTYSYIYVDDCNNGYKNVEIETSINFTLNYRKYTRNAKQFQECFFGLSSSRSCNAFVCRNLEFSCFDFRIKLIKCPHKQLPTYFKNLEFHAN